MDASAPMLHKRSKPTSRCWNDEKTYYVVFGCVYGGLMRLYAWINTHAITQSTITHKHKLFKVPRVLIDGLFQNEQLKKILFLHPVRKHVAER